MGVIGFHVDNPVFARVSTRRGLLVIVPSDVVILLVLVVVDFPAVFVYNIINRIYCAI